MDFGALELQIFVSLTVILGAAFVALVCDYLKGHNEQLREQNIELRARRDEQERLAILDPVKWLESFGERNRQPMEAPASGVAEANGWTNLRPVLAPADSIQADFRRVEREPDAAHVVAEVVPEPARFPGANHTDVDDHWAAAPPRREVLSLEEIQEAIRAPETIDVESKPVSSGKSKPGLDIRSELTQIIKRSFGRKRTPPAEAANTAPESEQPAPVVDSEPEQAPIQASEADRTTASIDLLDRIIGRPATVAAPALDEEQPAVVVTPLSQNAEAANADVQITGRIEANPEPPPVPKPDVTFVTGPAEDTFTEATAPIMPLPVVPDPLPDSEPQESGPPPVEPLLEALAQNAASHEPEVEPAVNEEPLPAPLETRVEQSEPAAITPVKVVLPSGLHDQTVLSALAASGGKINGVVFAVGITDYKRVQETQGPQELEALLASVREMITSLLGPLDFAARSSLDSFILIFNNESGAAAQRRINQVSERLWDFQLRSLGVSSILFSWGAVEVQDEPFESAVAGATERLEQSRRSRKTASVTPAPRVVNG